MRRGVQTIMENAQHTPAEPVVYVPSAITTRQPQHGAVEARATAVAKVHSAGAELVFVPGVGEVWAYPDHRPDATAAPIREPGKPLPAWVKSAAVLMSSASVSLSLLTLAVPGLQALTATLWAVASATGTLGLVGGGAFALIRFMRPSARRGNVTATATATSKSLLGGKATATATATSKR
jgi:hypothetical protein